MIYSIIHIILTNFNGLYVPIKVHIVLLVRLAAHVTKGCKSLIRPSSGKDIAKTKGVHCEVESEGRWRQISGLTNRNHIRLQLRIRLLNKLKSNNYSELTVVNVADIWRESDVWYQGQCH